MRQAKELPCSEARLRDIIQEFGTPFHLYDEKGIRQQVQQLRRAMAWNQGFREYFAVKANPNPYLLEILRSEGCGADVSSMAELVLAKAVGWQDDEVVFSSNNTPLAEYEYACRENYIVNVDDVSHLAILKAEGLLPRKICFRYNPGNTGYGNDIIGVPEEAKYGMTKEQLWQALQFAKEEGIDWFGLHTMVVSNELSVDALVATATMMFNLAVEVKAELGITLRFLDLGGGIGLAYRPEKKPVDFAVYGDRVRQEYERILIPAGIEDLPLALECGRIITGPFGWLVTSAVRYKNTYKNYIGLDTCMVDLMRPGMYGAYHHLTVLGKDPNTDLRKYDVVGSLCENNDKFAIDRELPEILMGDIVIIHDTGAHGYAMGFNYNGKLKSRELLLREDGTVQTIRREETLADYFATLDYPGLNHLS